MPISASFKLRRHARTMAAFVSFSGAALAVPSAHAQISLGTAVDLALRNNPRVQLAEADVLRARAALQENRDVYIPSLAGTSGLGYSYGFPLTQPTLFGVQAQSLVLSFSQRDYIRSARAGLAAANFSLIEARQAVAEDTVLTYLALEHDLNRVQALGEERGYAEKLVDIVQTRLDAGRDTPIDLTTSRITSAQIRLAQLQSDDNAAVDRAHLAHLTGLPAESLEILPNDVPAIPAPTLAASSLGAPVSPGVDAAYANARAKRQQAFGDNRYLLRPQIALGANYSRLSSFNNYQTYYATTDPSQFTFNSFGLGIQFTFPVLDYARRARARQSAAEALHAEREADNAQNQFTEGRLRTARTVRELAARAEIAQLDQQLAQQQIEVLSIQLQAQNSSSPMTPKDEQNAHITERDKYLTYLDSNFQLRQIEVNLLRQTGGLERWLKDLAAGKLAPASTTQPVTGVSFLPPAPAAPQPGTPPDAPQP